MASLPSANRAVTRPPSSLTSTRRMANSTPTPCWMAFSRSTRCAPRLVSRSSSGLRPSRLSWVVHELDACRRRAGGVEVTTDPQRVEHRPPIRCQIDEGTRLVPGAGLALEDRRLHARPARNRPSTGPAMPAPTITARRVSAVVAGGPMCSPVALGVSGCASNAIGVPSLGCLGARALSRLFAVQLVHPLVVADLAQHVGHGHRRGPAGS